jgi:superfamily II DNA or RNA helicase
VIFIFRKLPSIEIEYRTQIDKVINDFYVPILSEAISYKRAVGFFSSSILSQISIGLCSIARRGGKIKLLVSHRISKEDFDTISKAYNLRSAVSDLILKDYTEPSSEVEKDRFSLLSHLILNNSLDIKIAIMEKNAFTSMYHEKMGIVRDMSGDMITFSGSANETSAAFLENYETIDVFCSWKGIDSEERCNKKDMAFDRLWDDHEKGVIVLDIPEALKSRILSYKDRFSDDVLEIDEKFLNEYTQRRKKMLMPSTEGVKLYDYQLSAIKSWKENNYCGIFDMATGTGKTFTAGGGISELFKVKKNLCVVICCPYIHLVDQWYDEMKFFNIEGIKCYSSNSEYKKQVTRAVSNLELGMENFMCIITTNGTFMTKFMQEKLLINIDKTLLICDEAHNFGADKLQNYLNSDIPYRLALSATLDRYGDEIGTKRLYDFFGQKCIEYSLAKAIQEGKLTPYMYYPILVNLTDSELDSYLEISNQIKKSFHQNKDELSDYVKMLLLKRARIVSGAQNKISKLLEVIEPYKTDDNLLVYCGAVKYGEYDYEDADEDKRQIEVVLERLHSTYKMRISKFTSEENQVLRNDIKTAFTNRDIQGLVAIKCLDEGVNIPSIKTAFILASGTNPKEYIQRRGRVLRKFEGKSYSEIYDFITITRPIDQLNRISNDDLKDEISLVNRELERIIDFASIANNPSHSNEIIKIIREAYKIGEKYE